MGRLSDALRALDLFADYVREDLNLELNPRETKCYVQGVAASGIGCSCWPGGVRYLGG